MATAETLVMVWAKLDARWSKALADMFPVEKRDGLDDHFRRDDFLSSLADVPDAILIRAVDRLRANRTTLYPHDNLVALIREEATAVTTAAQIEINRRWVHDRLHYWAEAERIGITAPVLDYKEGTDIHQRFRQFLERKVRELPPGDRIRGRIEAWLLSPRMPPQLPAASGGDQ